MGDVQRVMAGGGIRSVFQPIVDLDTGRVVAYEALARGPVGSDLERPDQLFAAARTQGVLAALDEACRLAAFRGAIEVGLLAPLTLLGASIGTSVHPDDGDNFGALLHHADVRMYAAKGSRRAEAGTA